MLTDAQRDTLSRDDEALDGAAKNLLASGDLDAEPVEELKAAAAQFLANRTAAHEAEMRQLRELAAELDSARMALMRAQVNVTVALSKLGGYQMGRNLNAAAELERGAEGGGR